MIKAYREVILGSRPSGYPPSIVFYNLDRNEAVFLYNWLKLHKRQPFLFRAFNEVTIDDKPWNRSLVELIFKLELPTKTIVWDS